MRVSKERAAQNRARILTAAARLFRERGLSGVGVDAVTDAAGLTHGSLYSQFGSKERLAVEALGHALSENAAELSDARTLDDFVSRYLSADHRARVGEGCSLTALAGDIPRQGSARRRWIPSSRHFRGPTIINCMTKKTMASDMSIEIHMKLRKPCASRSAALRIVVVEPFKDRSPSAF